MEGALSVEPEEETTGIVTVGGALPVEPDPDTTGVVVADLTGTDVVTVFDTTGGLVLVEEELDTVVLVC